MNLSAARLRWLYLRGPLWWMGLALLVTGTAILLLVYSLWQGEHRFEENALSTRAKVTRKQTRIEKTGRQGNTPKTIHVLVYTFQDAAGQQHEGKAEVSAQAWAEAKKGDALTIEYDRANPASRRLGGSATPVQWGLMATAGIGFLFVTFGIVTGACLLIRSGRRARLIQTGVPALGVVDEVVENDSALKVAGTFRVLFQFTDGQGATWQGRGPPQPWSLAGRWEPGDAILVLYDPRNPGRNEADLFEVRPDELAELQNQTSERRPVAGWES